MKRIELLNSEGPVLTASHHDSFSIDEEKNILLKFHGGKTYIVTENELRNYLLGNISLKDSAGKVSIYTEYPLDMRSATSEQIQKFFNNRK